MFSEDVPEDGGGGGVGDLSESDLGGALFEFGFAASGLGDAGEVAFDVGEEYGDAEVGEGFGEDLEGDGFSGSGRAGDEAVAVGELGQEVDGDGGLPFEGCGTDEDGFGHGFTLGGQGTCWVGLGGLSAGGAGFGEYDRVDAEKDRRGELEDELDFGAGGGAGFGGFAFGL